MKNISALLFIFLILSACQTDKEELVRVETVSISPSTVYIGVGHTIVLSADIYPENSLIRNVHWSSDDPFVVSVDSRGQITGLKTGSAVITAYADGVTSQCNVYVDYTPIVEHDELIITISDQSVLHDGDIYNVEIVYRDGHSQRFPGLAMEGGIITVPGPWDQYLSNTDRIKIGAISFEVAKLTNNLITLNETLRTQGSGTQSDPFCILNGEILERINDILYMRRDRCYFSQFADIDLSSYSERSGGWPGLGTESRPFNGYYDGRGFSIGSLIITENGGLFKHISSEGVLDNIVIRSGNVFSGGALCGHNYGAIRNCTNYAEITSSIYPAAGICLENYGIISQCTNYGKILSGEEVAGICYNNWGDILHCYNMGEIEGNNCAGIALYSGGDIMFCFNYGWISGINAAGIALRSSSTISQCFNTGFIAGTECSAGIAINAIYIIYCSNKGSIGRFNNQYWNCGIAFSAESIHYCYNVGDISELGVGIAAQAWDIMYSYNAGSASAGISQRIDANFGGCFYDNWSSPIGVVGLDSDPEGIRGISTNELQSQYGLDLLNAHGMFIFSSPGNGQYPILTWELDYM